MLIKQALKYIIKTNWQQMRADYGHWKLLRGACRELAEAVNEERLEIRTVFANCPYDGSHSCLNYVWHNLTDNNGEYVIIPCKHFDDSHECSETKCKYYIPNIRYVASSDQYATVRDMKRKFWAETFANVK